MAKSFWNKKLQKCCAYCAHGRDCPGSTDTLCIKRGLVAADHLCHSYIYDPLRRTPQPRKQLEKFSAKDFEI